MILKSDAFAAAALKARARFLIRSSGVGFQGCLSRMQRPQFQPRPLLQCHPGPQPSAIRSTMRDTPICNNGGPGKMAFAHASTTTEASKRTIMAANKRSSSSVRNMEVPLAELTKPESHTAGWSGFGRKTPRLCRCRRTGAFWRVSTAGVVSLPIATGEPAMIAVAATELDGKHKG